MNKNRLYLLLSLGIAAGYAMLLWSLKATEETESNDTVCFFKNTTGIACPSCGNTRALVSLARGNIADALLVNPLSIVVAAILLLGPLWILYDVLLSKDSLYRGYLSFEKAVRRKWIAVLLITLIVMNWVWNIYKGL